jgi:hypothetical protein
LWNNTTPAYTLSSNTSKITFGEILGNYTAVYNLPTGFVATPPSSNLVVVGNLTTNVTFPATFVVTFTETGVPSGQSWTVFFTGIDKTVTASDVSGTITFSAPNGTWSYGILAPSGYSVTPAHGTLSVAGKATGAAATFSSTTSSSNSPTYLSKLAWELIAAVAVLAVIGFALAGYLAMRRPPAAPPPKGWSDETPAAETPSGPSNPETEFDSEPGSKT